MTNATLTTTPLSRADQAELLDFLSSDDVSFRAVPLKPGELGEPVTAIAVITLSMAAITAMCSWLGSKGRGVSMTLNVSAPGGFSGAFSLTLSDQSKPEAVRAELKAKGIGVPDK